ncbi:MAG: SprT family zinc-dependent metalloprotease [Paracoccus sp. (in: a-proteobacteria)]|nr:SprT family zinc-dependent metalloprotease [Paracoccus sp. (in: a-proteobacteria)]
MADEHIDIGGEFRVALRRHARARRMTLRVAPTGAVTLTLPPGAPLGPARAFAESRLDWLRAAKGRAAPPQIVAEGAVLPVAGADLRITRADVKLARIEGGALLIPARGAAGRQVAIYLRGAAHAALRAAVTHYAGRIGREVRAMALRDTRSRWGSCTHDGRLMFSWRLAMAPPEVLDYVAAHEVAHLAHMDHSPAFWAQVGALLPGYQAPRRWLKLHGGQLQAWRFDAET